MEKENIKKEFMEELQLFCALARRDMQKGFTVDQVKNNLEKCVQSFYGARLDFDDYATEKCSFIATYSNQIISGNLTDEYLEEYYNDVKDKERRR